MAQESSLSLPLPDSQPHSLVMHDSVWLVPGGSEQVDLWNELWAREWWSASQGYCFLEVLSFTPMLSLGVAAKILLKGLLPFMKIWEPFIQLLN